MSNKVSKQGASAVKRLIIMIVITMVAAQILPSLVLLFIYPALMLGLILLLPIFHKYRKDPDFSFFGNLCFAAILCIALYLLLPLAVLNGFMGFGIISLVYVGLAMASERVMGSDIDATLMTIIFLVLVQLLHLFGNISYWIPAFVASAVLLDLTRAGFSPWVRGMMAGLVWSCISFGFSNLGPVEVSIIVVYSAAAGLLAGSLFGLFHLTDEKHIEKLLKKF